MLRLAYALVLVLIGSSLASAETPRLVPDLALSIDAPGVLAQQRAVVDRDPKPTSGIGSVIVGWAGTGIAVLNLATIPLCYVDFWPNNNEGLCLGFSLAFAGVGLAVGIPFLIVGYNQRARYNAWRARERARQGIASHLLNLQVAVAHGGGMILYRGNL